MDGQNHKMRNKYETKEQRNNIGTVTLTRTQIYKIKIKF